MRRAVEHELQKFQVEPLPKFETDLRNMCDLDKAETLVQPQAGRILSSNAHHEDVEIAGPRFRDDGAHEIGAKPAPACGNVDVDRELDGILRVRRPRAKRAVRGKTPAPRSSSCRDKNGQRRGLLRAKPLAPRVERLRPASSKTAVVCSTASCCRCARMPGRSASVAGRIVITGIVSSRSAWRARGSHPSTSAGRPTDRRPTSIARAWCEL